MTKPGIVAAALPVLAALAEGQVPGRRARRKITAGV
jgi:hypothetical protein